MRKLAWIGHMAAVALVLAPLTAMADQDTEGASSESDLSLATSECHSLMSQFDGLHTKNLDALSLRKKAGNNCADAQVNAKQDGIKELKTALKMVGAEPLY